MDCSPPGSSVHEESPGKNTGEGCHALLQGNLPNPGIEPRYSAWRADSLPGNPISSMKVKITQSCLTLCDPWTVAYQAPLSMGFSRQENWSGLPFPSPGDLPNPGIEPGSPALQADALPSKPPRKPHFKYKITQIKDFTM